MTFFSINECEQIISLAPFLEEVYRNDKDRNISYTYWSIGNCTEYKWIFDRFDKFLIDHHPGLQVVKQLDAIHMFRYRTGDTFTRHKDIYYPNQLYNVGVNLTDSYEGGEFILYNPTVELPKKRGALYQFLHSREHEVLRIKNGERWSLIGFYFYDNFNISKPLL